MLNSQAPHYKLPTPPHGPSTPLGVHLPPSRVTWSGVAEQMRTLLTRNPLLTGGLVVGAGAAIVLAYRASLRSRQRLLRRRQAKRFVRTAFVDKKIDILQYIYEQPWNHFPAATLDSIHARFLALLSGNGASSGGEKDKQKQQRGLLPLSDLVQLYRKVGVTDERVALACARWWDMDGNCVIDFQEFAERLNLAVFGSKLAKLRACFDVFDLDGSGTISKREMEEVMHALRTADDRQMLHETVERIYRSADANLDGLISLPEFMELAEVENLTISFNREFVRAFGLEAN